MFKKLPVSLMATGSDPPPFNIDTLLAFSTCQTWKRHWVRERFLSLVDPWKNFYIGDATRQKHLDCVRVELDSVMDDFRHKPLLHVVYRSPSMGQADLVLRGILGLGADPDVLNRDGKAAPALYLPPEEMVKVLSRCRPALTFEDRRLSKLFPSSSGSDVYWRIMETHGYPSLARLAHEEHWYAVQNLCRRRVVTRHEAVSDTNNGKTAIEWAQQHGPPGLAEEMKFLLKIERNDLPEEGVPGLGHVKEMPLLHLASNKTNDNPEKLKRKVAELEAENSALVWKVDFQEKIINSLKRRNEELRKEVTRKDMVLRGIFGGGALAYLPRM